MASVDNQSYGLLFESLGNMDYEGQENTFTVTVASNGGQGDYDLDIIEVSAALPDVITESLTCPTSEKTYTDEEITLQWTLNLYAWTRLWADIRFHD